MIKKIFSFLKKKKKVEVQDLGGMGSDGVYRTRGSRNKGKQTQSKKVEQKQTLAPKQRDNNRPERKANNKAKNENKPKAKPKKQVHKPYKPAHTYKTPIPTGELVFAPKVDDKTRFCDLGLDDKILHGFQDLKFEYCTPIQEICLPLVLEGKDISGKAQTGTGKTAAFLTAIFDNFLKNPKPNRHAGACRALILAPTRELALQIQKDADEISKYCGFRNVCVVGGMDRERQRIQLEKPVDILIGTPGRVIDFMLHREICFSHTEYLVIDEADRLLDMGFIPDVTRIVMKLPELGQRQTMFFSATFSKDIKNLVASWLHEPVVVNTTEDEIIAELIDQKFYTVSTDQKFNLLLSIIKNENIERLLIFVNTKYLTKSIAGFLKRKNVRSEILSGEVAQSKRIQVLEDFRSGKNKIIVATDVAARGIHVDDVSHVINFDLPQNRPEEYIHRVGRTGRAGKTGKAYSFVCEYGGYIIPDIEEELGVKIESEWPPEGWC